MLLYNLYRLVDPGNKRLPLKHLYATLPIGKRPNLSRVQKAGVENEKISMMTSCHFGDTFFVKLGNTVDTTFWILKLANTVTIEKQIYNY